MFEKLRPAQAPEELPENGDEQSFQPAEAVPSADHEAPVTERPVGRLRPSLASLLADEGVASKEQLEHAAAEGLESGERLGEVVLRRGWITEAGLANLIARQWDLTFVARSLISVDEDAQARMSREAAHQLGICPVTSNDGEPLVAVADPSEERFTAARDALGGEYTFVVTTPSALAQLIDELPASPPAPAVVSLADVPAPAAPILSLAEVEPEPEVEPEVESEVELQPDVEPEVEPEADPTPATFSTPVAIETPEPADDGSPVLDQLDRLLNRLVSERVRTGDELAGYRRQLDDLAAEKARLEESLRSVEDSIRSLEAKLGQEDELLDSMRTKLADLS
jgi:hypothetical protein